MCFHEAILSLKFDKNIKLDIQCSVSTWQQFAAGHSGCSVALVLDEGEASVLRFVGSAGVHDDVHNPISDLPHLSQDLLALLGFGNPAYKQTAVVHAGTNSQEAAIPAGRKRSTVMR